MKKKMPVMRSLEEAVRGANRSEAQLVAWRVRNRWAGLGPGQKKRALELIRQASVSTGAAMMEWSELLEHLLARGSKVAR